MRKRRRLNSRRSGRRVGRLNRSSRTGPFPRTAVVSLRYFSNTVTLDAAVGGHATHSFRANDLNIPDATAGVTHQPYGHDTLATVYNRYKVLSSKITVVFQPLGGDSLSGGIAAVQLNTVPTPTANETLFLEQPETSYKPLGPLTGNKGVVTVSKTYNAARFYGKKRNFELTANFNSTPVEQAFFHISVQPVNVFTNMAAVDCSVTVTYKVLCTEPVALGQS